MKEIDFACKLNEHSFINLVDAELPEFLLIKRLRDNKLFKLPFNGDYEDILVRLSGALVDEVRSTRTLSLRNSTICY